MNWKLRPTPDYEIEHPTSRIDIASLAIKEHCTIYIPTSMAISHVLSRTGILALLLLAARPSNGFSNHSPIRTLERHPTSTLFAEGGAPQYEKQAGILQKSECVGKGSYLLTIDYENEQGDDNEKIHYDSGHVLALEIQPPSEESDDAKFQITEKTRKDSENNDGYMLGPYTVSFGYGTDKTKKDGFKVLVKEVGYKSHVFATSEPGTPVRFGGKFKVPIAQGIRTSADADETEQRGSTKQVVLISSGVGVGPCVGAVEELLESSPSSIDSIDLIASYRTREEICMEPNLQELQSSSSGPQFLWKPIITSEDGRLASNGPEALQKHLPQGVSTITNTHYHIIGNGQLVNEWKEGLKKAGVPASRVTVEAYFNHAAKAHADAIDAICEAILGLEDGTMTKANEAQEAAAL